MKTCVEYNKNELYLIIEGEKFRLFRTECDRLYQGETIDYNSEFFSIKDIFDNEFQNDFRLEIKRGTGGLSSSNKVILEYYSDFDQFASVNAQFILFLKDEQISLFIRFMQLLSVINLMRY